MTSNVEQSIDVDVPIGVAYAQWTQFESFPEFMEGITAVRQIDETHVHFSAKVAGIERSWDAEITEQHLEERVAWKSTSGKQNAGAVTFHKLDDGHTRVSLMQDVETEGIVEKAGDALGLIDHRAKADLERFKTFIEAKGAAPAGYTGDVAREG